MLRRVTHQPLQQPGANTFTACRCVHDDSIHEQFPLRRSPLEQPEQYNSSQATPHPQPFDNTGRAAAARERTSLMMKSRQAQQLFPIECGNGKIGAQTVRQYRQTLFASAYDWCELLLECFIVQLRRSLEARIGQTELVVSCLVVDA